MFQTGAETLRHEIRKSINSSHNKENFSQQWNGGPMTVCIFKGGMKQTNKITVISNKKMLRPLLSFNAV
jgi:hypothetical protein